MILDTLGQFCSAQAFTQAAVSESSVDIGLVATGAPSKKDLGGGEALGAYIQVTTVGAHATNPATGYLVNWVTDTVADLASPTQIADIKVIFPAQAAVGTRRFLFLPMGIVTAGERYLGLYVTGTTWANISLGAWLCRWVDVWHLFKGSTE